MLEIDNLFINIFGTYIVNILYEKLQISILNVLIEYFLTLLMAKLDLKLHDSVRNTQFF